MRDVMTPEQVADYLQLHKDTVYRLIRGGSLGATKIGRAYRVSKSDVERFLLANNTNPEIRALLFQRVVEIGERNARRYPDLTSDDVLEELEQIDQEAKQRRAQKV